MNELMWFAFGLFVGAPLGLFVTALFTVGSEQESVRWHALIDIPGVPSRERSAK